MAETKTPMTLRSVTRFLKKKKKETKGVVKGVYKGVKKDWDALMKGLGGHKK